MKKKFSEDDMFEGYVESGTETQTKKNNIYDKMYDWSHDKYGDKTKPNFETWIDLLSEKELNTLHKIINKI